ncbi:MAG: helix-turn-helix transcriptional regulator [Actinomycetota bacterium]|nr:helix-turn-helix transcriptional regulator [Actinomycetota bacterium]
MEQKLFDVRNNLVYLLVLRWAALLHVAVLLVLGLDIGPPAAFLALIAYVFILTMFWGTVTELVRERPLLLHVDLLIAGALIAVTGGAWKSSYYMYAYTCLMVFPFFVSMRKSVLATVVFSAYYTLGLFVNEGLLDNVVHDKQIDSLFSNYIAFFLVVLFFGYPACVMKKLESVKASTAQLRTYVDETHMLLAAAERQQGLTPRESEVLALLHQGMTNAEIAATLYLSEKTVKNHLYSVYRKLGVSSRSEAMLQSLPTKL